MKLCFICGASENEVKALFCFPKNPNRLRLWQDKFGMKFNPNLSKRYRVCDKHFSRTEFRPGSMTSLAKFAVPNPWPKKQHQVPVLIEDSVNLPSTSTNKSEQILPTSTSYCKKVITPENTSLRVTDRANLFPVENIPSLGDIFNRSFSPEGSLSTSSEPDQILPTEVTKVRRSLFKNIEGLTTKNASPRKEALMKILRKKEGHLRRLKKTCKSQCTQLKDFANIHKTPQFNNLLKGMPSSTAQFMISQIRCSKRSPFGRRWTLDDEVMALAIYKKSPKCYSLLRRLFALPSRATLTTLLERVPFNVGINDHIIKYLAECLRKFPETERLCSIAFDEMAIKEHLQYNENKDYMEGVEDFGTERTERVANYALVFLAQGVLKSWKQPLAYYFSRGGVDSTRLSTLLTEVLCAMENHGIPVLSTVCNMSMINVKMLKSLGATQDSPFFVFGDRKIYTIYDVPHLLKSTRNLFKKYNVALPARTIIPSSDTSKQVQASWSDIVKAYEEDKKSALTFRGLYKLKDFYFLPLRPNAMKVSVAAQTLSRSVAVFINVFVRQGILPQRALATAEFVNSIDEIFDSCNGTAFEPCAGEPFRCAVGKNTGHVEFWDTARSKINTWRFIRKTTDEKNSNCWKPPSQRGWLHTLKALKLIWEHLQTFNIEHFRPRALNQDALENLFGAIRSGCGCNENPTVAQFIGSFKTQVINGLAKDSIENTNCEEDDFDLLSDLKSLLSIESPVELHQIEKTAENELGELSSNIAVDVKRMVTSYHSHYRWEKLSVAYIASFIVKRLFLKFQCNACREILTSDDLEPCNQFIAAREFSDKHKKRFYPSEKLVVTVGESISLLELNMRKIRKEAALSTKIEELFKRYVDFNLLDPCPNHFEFVRDSIIKSVCKIGVPWYCARIVRKIKTDAKNNKKRKKMSHN